MKKKKPILLLVIFNKYYMAHILTSSDFDSTIGTGLTLVDMYADWCGPCQAIAPIIEELSQTYEGKANICKLNVDNSGDIAMRYGVMSIPTLLLFKDGQLVEKAIGLQTKDDLCALIDKHL